MKNMSMTFSISGNKTASGLKNTDAVFVRYEYDSEAVNWRDPRNNRLAAHKITQGQIRFAAPDRARYETTNILLFSRPPQTPNGDAEYKQANDAISQERWICDGKSVFDFDFSTKRLYETKIPPKYAGKYFRRARFHLFLVLRKK